MWIEKKTGPDEVHILWFDPGGITGWAHLCFNVRAFSRPANKALRHLRYWQCGEFEGDEHEQIKQGIQFAWQCRYHDLLSDTHVGTEKFDLVQLVGGDQLLSPVRINAALDYNLREFTIPMRYQRRNERLQMTADRLRYAGFDGKWTATGRGKDAFAAMQHAVVYTRKLKVASRKGLWRHVNYRYGL